jgi:hypothetical protein
VDVHVTGDVADSAASGGCVSRLVVPSSFTGGDDDFLSDKIKGLRAGMVKRRIALDIIESMAVTLKDEDKRDALASVIKFW